MELSGSKFKKFQEGTFWAQKKNHSEKFLIFQEMEFSGPKQK